ncbi:Tryptophan--tRNA ligase [compost metagenome]
MYGPFKKDLAEVVVAKLEPIQERYRQIRESGEITNILRQGAERAEEMAAATLAEVQKRMGFLPKA